MTNLGHRKIGFIGGLPGEAISKHRCKEFVGALRSQGLTVRAEYIKVGDFRITGGTAAMQELLAMPDPPTAVFTANDMTAIGALHAAQKMGYIVGEDVSIVGMDDIAFAELTTPALTTLRLSRPEMAQAFFDALDNFGSQTENSGQQYKVTSNLVIRDSTGPMKTRKRQRAKP